MASSFRIMAQRAFSWSRHNLRQRGFTRTCKVAYTFLEDYLFDWRHGTETHRWLLLDEMEDGLDKEHSRPYQASKARPFVALLRKLDVPAGGTFVDVGSGKGRALLLAAQDTRLRFRRVVGVEFSEILCEQAQQNVEIFKRRAKHLAPIEVIQGDAARYTFDGDENVIFLYNSFDGEILREFLRMMERSLVDHPRKLWFIYSVPKHADVVEQSGLFPHRVAHNIAGNDVFVYSTADAAVPLYGVAGAA